MTMTQKGNHKQFGFIFNTIDELVPQDHLVRKLESSLDWSFIYPLVKDLYSDKGRKSIDPVVLFKMIFIDKLFGINSMRKTTEEIKVNIAYRWFLGLGFDDDVPNYSTWSQNYIRRYNDSDIFDKIFDHIIDQALSHKFINLETVFGDSTFQKANANKRKSHKEIRNIIKKKYEDDLLKEINEERALHDQKPFTNLKSTEIIFDESTGEERLIYKTKEIKVSDIDPECGNFHKGEHEEQFAYNHQTFCDKNGFVLAYDTIPSNYHDSVSFFDTYHKLNDKYKDIKNICLDSGYKTAATIKEIISHDQTPYLPYKSPMTKEGYFKKHEYVYDEKEDHYLCPNDKILNYSTTTKDGYKQYKAKSYHCMNCPFKAKCTKSKEKIINRHIWEEYKEKAEEIRYTKAFKEIYPLRKQTIERVFADSKENHGLRYTRVRGLRHNYHNASIIFASHNLKKLALWIHKDLNIVSTIA